MIEPNTIHCGDCLELMPQIADKSVDMILCDLPYGSTKNNWDSIIPLDKLWEQYERVIKPNGAIVLFSQQPFTSKLVMSNPKLFKYEWIWQKEMGTGFLNAKKMPMKDHENILVFYDKLPTYNPQMKSGKPYKMHRKSNDSTNYGDYHVVDADNKGERYPTTVLQFNRGAKGLHPTAKPVALCQYLIRTYTKPGGVILDNTMGSGSTIVAAIKENRQYIGIEKDEHYFEIAKERIKAETSQLSLF